LRAVRPITRCVTPLGGVHYEGSDTFCWTPFSDTFCGDTLGGDPSSGNALPITSRLTPLSRHLEWRLAPQERVQRLDRQRPAVSPGDQLKRPGKLRCALEPPVAVGE